MGTLRIERGVPEYPQKNLRSKDENQQQTQPTFDTESGNRTRPHWWEASALTTAPSLLTSKCRRPTLTGSLKNVCHNPKLTCLPYRAQEAKLLTNVGSFFVYRMQMKHIVEPLFVESLYFGAVLFLVFCFYYFTSYVSGTPSKSPNVQGDDIYL